MARLPRFDSRRPRAAVIIAWLAVIAATAAAATVAPDWAREAARAVLSGGDYQRTLPSPLADAPDDRDADRRAAPTERRAITPRRSRPPEAMGDLARLLAWALP